MIKKLMDFFTYLVGGAALLGLAGGIIYGMYTACGLIGAGITIAICLIMLISLSIGLLGKHRKKEFPLYLSMILLLGTGLLILMIPFGAAMTSLHKNLPPHAPVTRISNSPSPGSARVSPSPISSSPTVAPTPSAVTAKNSTNDSGTSPYLIALLVGLAALAVIIILFLILKSGGDISDIGW